MPRCEPIHQGLKLLSVNLGRQIQPGSFEHARRHLVDHEPDLTAFHARHSVPSGLRSPGKAAAPPELARSIRPTGRILNLDHSLAIRRPAENNQAAEVATWNGFFYSLV